MEIIGEFLTAVLNLYVPLFPPRLILKNNILCVLGFFAVQYWFTIWLTAGDVSGQAVNGYNNRNSSRADKAKNQYGGRVPSCGLGLLSTCGLNSSCRTWPTVSASGGA